MAKIGYLFLHGGQWEGRQIVSRLTLSERTGALLVMAEGKMENP
jgi:hypothetical protein